MNCFTGNGQEQLVGLKIQLKVAKEITELSNSMPPLSATVTDSLFFKYTIEDLSDLENLLLLLNVSNKRDL